MSHLIDTIQIFGQILLDVISALMSFYSPLCLSVLLVFSPLPVFYHFPPSTLLLTFHFSLPILLHDIPFILYLLLFLHLLSYFSSLISVSGLPAPFYCPFLLFF